MAWPEPLGRLLARSDSRAAQALRWGLCGLRASLQAARAETADDAGGADLRNVLNELDALLVRTDTASAPVLPTDDRTEPDADAPRLLALAQAMAADARLQAELSRSHVRKESDDQIWNDAQRLLLRVAPGLAEEWRRRCLKQAEQAGGRADETATASVPLGRDQVIFPGLTDSLRASGLRARAVLHPRIAVPDDPDLQPLAGVTSVCLWFVGHDSYLCHCLRSVFRFGITPMTEEQRERYSAELLRLWERFRAGVAKPQAAGRQAWKEWLKTCLDLDEAIHSLVYQPPAALDSWWGKLQAQAREALFRLRDRAVQAGCPVHLQALGGSFADISRLAPDSLQVDFGVPGEVAVCLRLWARVDGEELKGRALYRPPREEA